MKHLLQLTEAATGVTCDSRQIIPGCIFVAIRGRSTDGNAFAGAAVKNGAAAVVTDYPSSLPPLGIPVIAVPDARRALAELSAAFYRHPSRQLALTGVTGTNGKTTVTFMLDGIFRQAGLATGLIGTVCVNTGRECFPSSLTTPDAVALQHYLAAMRRNGVTHAAMEVSAQGMELKRVDNVAFACGILTNVSPDHLDFHGDFSAYLAAKEQFPALLGSAPLVVNSDDPHCRRIARRHGGPVITAGMASPAGVTARITRLTSFGSLFELTWHLPPATAGSDIPRTGTALIKLPLPGRHNIENAVMAATAALLQGIPVPVITRALAAFAPVSRRMEVARLAGMTVVDDTALNPGSIDAVFTTIGAFRYRRLIVVNAIRGCRGAAINAANADTLAAWWRRQPFALIITSSTGSVDQSDLVLENEKSAFIKALENSGICYSFTGTLPEAIGTALDTANCGDLILLLGAQGMDDGFRILREQAAVRPDAAADWCFEPADASV